MIIGEDYMNIKEYYKSAATTSINISIYAALLSVIVFVILSRFLHTVYVWEATVPFMLLSCLFYIQFHVNKKRYQEMPDDLEVSDKHLFEHRNVLMTFMPAPTMRIVLFNPRGQCIGEIKDKYAAWYKWLIPNELLIFLPQSYYVLDVRGKKLGSFKISGFLGRNMTVWNSAGERIAAYEENLKKSLFRYNGVVYDDKRSVRMKVNVSGYLRSFEISSSEGRKLVSFQKGYMPLEWSNRFKELNTPILTFTEETVKDDMIAIYALCAKLLSYSKN